MAGSSPAMTTLYLFSRRDLHIFEFAGLVVDADFRRRYPVGEFAGFALGDHQRTDKLAVLGGGQVIALHLGPFGVAENDAFRRSVDVPELADLAMERGMRQFEAELDAGFFDDLVPALDALGAVGRVVVAQPHVERGQRRFIDQSYLAIDQLQHLIDIAGEAM